MYWQSDSLSQKAAQGTQEKLSAISHIFRTGLGLVWTRQQAQRKQVDGSQGMKIPQHGQNLKKGNNFQSELVSIISTYINDCEKQLEQNWTPASFQRIFRINGALYVFSAIRKEKKRKENKGNI